MTNSDSNNRGSPRHEFHLAVDKTARYRIRVVGYLDARLSTRLGGFAIESSGLEATTPATTLSGTVLDQAALFGVLKALYDMRLPLLSVECLEVT